MALYDETVEAEVHGLLAERGYEVAASAYVAGVTEDGQLGQTAVKLDGYLPHGSVAVELFFIAGETAVDGSKTLYACTVDSLECSYPEFKVRVDRVFDQHRIGYAAHGIGQQLHGEGVGAGAGTYPEYINIGFEGKFHMLGCGYLGGNEHAGFFFYALEPWQGFLAVAFKAAGLGARFPYSGSEHVAALAGKLHGGGKCLLLSLSGAGTCNYKGTTIVAGQVEGL